METIDIDYNSHHAAAGYRLRRRRAGGVFFVSIPFAAKDHACQWIYAKNVACFLRMFI
jgi:hypothetical protein